MGAKKKFASFLLAGKLGLAPFIVKAEALSKDVKSVPITQEKLNAFASIYSLSPDVFTEKKLHVVEYPDQGITLENLDKEIFQSPYSDVSAYVEIPGEGCTFSAPSEMKLIITGLKPNEEVFIVAGPEENKDQDLISQTHGKLKVGLNGMKVLGVFTLSGKINLQTLPGISSPLEASEVVIPIVIKVNFNSLNSGDRIYIQAIAFPKGDYSWEKARASELDLIEVRERNCSPYGGGGAPY